MMDAMEFEQYIIEGDFPDDLPERARELFIGEVAQGVPTAFGKHPTEGYFVIQTSGQGPYIIWSEKEGMFP